MNASHPPDLRLRAREVFFVALDQPDAAGRARLVAAECQADADLQRHVERLLDDHFTDDGFMATPAGGQLEDSLPDEAPGARIGRYRIVRKLGEGGMGVVYLAEQEEPVRRQVALKIIKLGMDTRQVVARFEAERQALAMMDHPNIAKVLDAGTTGDAVSQISNLKSQIPGGRPYFVMELVLGVPLVEFCEANQCSLEERLQLFIAVCRAIQHAHQKGIIHRDLKPSNVLVTRRDGQPTPKVIDFGVAKAIQQKLTDKTLLTNFGALIGTPAYMSPEQAEMSGLDVDTRSDIYSLGVLLYELLTGSPPFPEKRLRSVPHREMQRILLEEEPERPSVRLGKAAPCSPLSTNHYPLSTDLDWIVMKCLEKDRARRYDTASGLAADVDRYLAHEPILARPPRTADRVHKWIQRHKVQFASLMTIATVLLVATAVSTWQALRATRAQRSFQEQAKIAQSVKDFLLKQLVGSGDAWEDRPFDTNNRALIQRIARELEGQFTHQPEVEAEIRHALGVTMNWMDDFPASLAQTERAWALRKRHLGPAHSDTLRSASETGYNLYNLGRHQEGDRVLDEAIAEARAASQIATHGAAEALWNRGWKLAFDGRPAEAMPYLREALTNYLSALGEGHSQTSAGRFMVASATDKLGDREEARRLYEAGLNDCLRFHGANHRMTATFLKGYALFLIEEKQYDRAIEKLESAIAIWREAPAHGPDNLYTLESEGFLAVAFEKKGDVAEAIRRNRDLHRRYTQHLRNYRSYRRVRDLAAFFVRHRLYADATAAYEDLKRALTEVPPQRASEFELLLQSTAATGGWQGAGYLCRTHLDAFPDSLPTWLQKAQVFRYLEDEENYVETVKRVLALPSTLVSTNEQHLPIEIAGLGLMELSPAERAEIQKKVAALEAVLPDRTLELQRAGYRAIAQFQLRAKQFSDCMKTLEKPALGMTDPDASALFLKALCLNRLGQLKEAQAALEAGNAVVRAREITPEFERFLPLADLYGLLVLQREAQAELAVR